MRQQLILGTGTAIWWVTEPHYAECLYAECLYAECCYPECRHADCLYAECRGAIFTVYLPFHGLKKCERVKIQGPYSQHIIFFVTYQ
jgi:hypothetical protein